MRVDVITREKNSRYFPLGLFKIIQFFALQRKKLFHYGRDEKEGAGADATAETVKMKNEIQYEKNQTTSKKKKKNTRIPEEKSYEVNEPMKLL